MLQPHPLLAAACTLYVCYNGFTWTLTGSQKVSMVCVEIHDPSLLSPCAPVALTREFDIAMTTTRGGRTRLTFAHQGHQLIKFLNTHVRD